MGAFSLIVVINLLNRFEMTEKNKNKYKHMRFGSFKAQRFFKSMEKEEKASTASGLLKSAIRRSDGQLLEKFAKETATSNQANLPVSLPKTSNIKSSNPADIFCLKDIISDDIRKALKKFATDFYTEFDKLNESAETVAENVTKVSERFLYNSEYFTRRAIELIEKAYREDTSVSAVTLGYYYLLSMLQQLITVKRAEIRKAGDDPLGFYGKLPYAAVDFVYGNFCSQEMQASSGKLMNTVSDEHQDKLLLHIIVLSILVQNLKNQKSFSLDHAPELFAELGLKNYKVSKLCHKVGLGVSFSNDRPDNIGVSIKAPLEIPIEKSFSRKERRR